MLSLLDRRGRFFGRWNAPDLLAGVVLFFLVFNSVSYAGGLVYAWLCDPEFQSISPSSLQLKLEHPQVTLKGKHLNRLGRRTKVELRHESGRQWEALRLTHANDQQMVLDLPEDLFPGSYSFIILGSLPQERTMKDVLYVHPIPPAPSQPLPLPEVVDQGLEHVTVVCLLKETRRPTLPFFYRTSLKKRLWAARQVLLSVSRAPKKEDGMLATLCLGAHKYTQGNRIFYYYQDRPLRYGTEIELPPECRLREKLVSDPVMSPWEKR